MYIRKNKNNSRLVLWLGNFRKLSLALLWPLVAPFLPRWSYSALLWNGEWILCPERDIWRPLRPGKNNINIGKERRETFAGWSCFGQGISTIIITIINARAGRHCYRPSTQRPPSVPPFLFGSHSRSHSVFLFLTLLDRHHIWAHMDSTLIYTYVDHIYINWVVVYYAVFMYLYTYANRTYVKKLTPCFSRCLGPRIGERYILQD